jgi:hypothetical protein
MYNGLTACGTLPPQPIYMHFLGVEIFGIGFLTSMSFILATGGPAASY